MPNFYTADLHLRDEEIIHLCDRPHKNIGHAQKRLIADANMRAKAGSTLIHVGDFAHRNKGEHPRDLIKLFDARLIFVAGNHDPNNGVATDCDYMVTEVCGVKALVTHYPTFNDKNEVIRGEKWDWLRDNAPRLADFVICGHVHKAWHTKRDPHTGIVNVNVGVDMNHYRPLTEPEVFALAKRGLSS